MTGIVKRFGAVTALDEVEFEAARGTIHAVAGENGAGKTTLMRILYGMSRPDAGTMALEGESFAPRGPAEALARGVGMVHQHFMLVPTLTVAENAVLGREPRRAGLLVDHAAAREEVAEIAARFGLDLDPDALVGELSVGEKQRLEILKVLLRGARILILDEPTAVLVPREARTLLETLRGLADDGATVLFITHRLREVTEAADEVTVLRRGANAGRVAAATTSERELARLMVGREMAVRDATPRRAPGADVLTVESCGEPEGGTGAARLQSVARLKEVTLRVREAEIVGVAGVEGNGQRELVEILAGLRPYRGTARISGKDIAGRGPAGVRKLGLTHVPEGRLEAGLIPEMTVEENLLLGRETEARFRRGPAFDRRAIRKHAEARLAAFDVRPARPDVPVTALSGGNQQKVVISREAEGDPVALLVAHPTRGVDVGAQEAIHDALLGLRDRGAAVLLVSADLSELLHLSDRIIVLYGGRVAGEFARGDVDEETLGVLMIGGGA
ncbi:MAG: ABC transporter ATP-binding protein [Gemmatimonadetes bacterium]|nr:ABC transporter ATP-binding protein [Gemmatimonadota bacterium]